MATLIAVADGNLTGSTTFAAAEAGALALVLNRFTINQIIAAGTTTSVTFTVTTSKVIDGVLLWLKQANVSTGIFKVAIHKGGVEQTSVTINKTDLPDQSIPTPLPIFFKFASTATGDGAANWTLVFTTTGTNSITAYTASATTTNFTRALRTTTTATPTTNDDLYVVGELTGAATHNTRTVTMNSTAATVYGNGAVNSTTVNGGGVHISNWGTLTYGTTAGTNYLLRVAGDVIVYQYGTLNMGSSAAASTGALDPATTTNTALSNGNLTATHSNTTLGGARSAAALSAGKWFFEVTLVTGHGSQDSMGVLPVASTYSNFSTEGVGVARSSGNITASGVASGTLGAVADGSIIGVAIDYNARLAWFRNGSGNWNGSGTANPATGVGGVAFPAITAFAPAVSFVGSGTALNDAYTANFGATTYANAAPSGFSNWLTFASTAILEFQPVSADGDFGLRALDNSVIQITGQPRTAGKLVTQCKLTANVASSSTLTAMQSTGITSSMISVLEASGNSILAANIIENSSNSAHAYGHTAAASITNTTQTGTVWLARGTGANNRYVRLFMGNNAIASSITNGFYSDIDLQAGTAGTVTAVGNGTATSVSITPEGRGYVIRMTGKVSSGAGFSYFHIAVCSAPGTITYTGSGASTVLVDRMAVVTASSISDTIFNVDTDTGWLSGDAVCVASTTRTASECEIYPLNANAGASSFTSALYPFSWNTYSTHHGTSPIQAEIGLITRNVKIRSTSTTLMAYVYCTALSTVTASWAEFYYVGTTLTNKRGIEIDGGAVCNPKSFTYCSLHDIDTWGLYCSTPTVVSLNVTFSNNVIWNNLLQSSIMISAAVTNTDWTFDSNLLMRISNYGFNLNDVSGICTNNTVVGCGTNYGFSLLESTNGEVLLGAFSGNTAHSGASGLGYSVPRLVGTISNFTAWRNTGVGVGYLNDATSDFGFSNLTLFGNGAGGGQFNATSGDTININGGLIAGDTTFASTFGFNIGFYYAVQFNLNNVDMSGSGSIFAPHTGGDFTLGSINVTRPRGVANNCKFGASSLIASAKSLWAKDAYLSFQKFNQTAGDHRTEMTYGQLKTDSAVYYTASPSMKMTPNNASNRLESAPKGEGIQVAVSSGDTVTASVWVRKDSAYNGSQPRLVVRANAAIGINSDTVLATYSAGTGSWNQLSGTTPSATDNGVMEFIVDCDGTAGFINLDDWSFTTGGVTTTNDLSNWFDGLPATGTEGGGGGYFSAGFV